MKKFLLSTGIVLLSAGTTYASVLYADRILERISIDFNNQEITKDITLGQSDTIKISDIFVQKEGLEYVIKDVSPDLQFQHNENDSIEILDSNTEWSYAMNVEICSPSQIESDHESWTFVHEVYIEDEE